MSQDTARQPILIERQGFLLAGGRMLTASDGQSYPIDHLYAEFEIPPKARPYPLVFVHGGSQAGTGWKMTPDGREGYESIFVRRGFATYIVDFPRRGGPAFPLSTVRSGSWTARKSSRTRPTSSAARSGSSRIG